ncbi:LytTR family DNA-binding domain-containing protein [uncultured Acetatifactor sp.]|jgi:DNA-binding LytR/AlgR family response regulator|uniref:LytTR family DNA-binding domain-containing protein n=1 Tax=uncultured Acetatifactor sp. TaxID=1671927 RepID=UPI0025DC41EF|nr:LytTR family DNA-binding domain-containing protein [uncultured Acetatifactor sp.]MCI8697147.1 LytTR family transcriptional regulator [Lachnospiraceae bacterium]MCI9572820.1 LytTR family transcriptional regulator [Lachnospiraceae bacterium]
MKITIQDLPEGEEEEIVIRCRGMDEQLLKLVYALRAGREKLTVSRQERLFRILPSAVYYFEAVDNRVFAYLEKEVYETKLKLYELEERLAGTDFFRASKSTVINLAKVESLSPAFNGRFEAAMKNGEKLIVSRQYVPVLKEKLGL